MEDHPFNAIAKLINEKVIHISLLRPGRTVKEEIINFFRNSILPNSTLLRNFVDFDGAKYMMLTNTQLIYVKAKGIDTYKISDRRDFNLNEIKNLNHQGKRGQDTIEFEYQDKIEKFKLFTATILPGGVYYDDPDFMKQTAKMQEEMVVAIKKAVNS